MGIGIVIGHGQARSVWMDSLFLLLFRGVSIPILFLPFLILVVHIVLAFFFLFSCLIFIFAAFTWVFVVFQRTAG